MSIRYAEKNKKVDLDQINLVKSFKSDCHLSWLKHIVRQSICRKDLKIMYLMGKRTKYESNSVSRNFFDCNQNVGKSLQTSRAKPLLGWSNNSLISRNFCKPLNFSMKSDLLLVKKNMLHSIFFILFCYGGKFIIQKMNEGAFVIVTHGFNNSSYKWRRSIGKKEEIIFYDLIILHSIAFTTEKVFMNHSEQYWKPKETKKSSQLFFADLTLDF